jgi:hypothetical protein
MRRIEHSLVAMHISLIILHVRWQDAGSTKLGKNSIHGSIRITHLFFFEQAVLKY